MAGATAGEVRQLSLNTARLEAFSKCVGPISFSGYQIKLCLSVSASGGDDVTLDINLTLGSSTYGWTETFGGDITYNLAITTGLSLQVGVSNWDLQSKSVSFTVTVKIFVFGLGATLYTGKVTVPIASAQERSAFSAIPVNSPRDLADLFGLLGQVTPATGAGETAGAPDMGSCTCAPNRRQGCDIRTSSCPPGQRPDCSNYPNCTCQCVPR